MSQQYDHLAMNLMALLLHDPKNFRDPRLTEAMFPHPLDRVYRIASSLYREGVKPSPEAIGVNLGEPSGEASKIAAQLMARSAPLVPFKKVIDAAAQHLARQRMLAVCKKFHELGSDDKSDFGEVLSQFQGEAIKIKVADEAGSLQVGSSFNGINERIKWKQNNPNKLRGLSTGYAALDRTLDGLTPRYYLVGARPSVGKTAELCDITGSICSEGNLAVIYTLEMPSDDYRERILSAWSRVPLSGFRDTPYTITELQAITRTQDSINKWNWFINDDPETSISDIEAQCMSLYRERGQIAMVGIDYIQLIRIASGKKDRWEQVAELSRRCKSLGRNLNTAMVVLSQLKRTEGVYKKETGKTHAKRPELQDLREAGDLEQDADVVQFIHRDIRHEPEKAEFIVAKQRGGPTDDSIPMIYKPQLTTFKDA